MKKPPNRTRRAKAPVVSVISLGCPKNQVDSEVIVSALLERGFEFGRRPDRADLIVINTCGFIGPAKEESIDTILEAATAKISRPTTKLLVSGCLYLRYPSIPQELPEVDYWLGKPQEPELDRILTSITTDYGLESREQTNGQPPSRRILLSEPGSAFLRISDGCDRTCAFCAIPAIKGALKSDPIERVVADARWLVDQFGIKEINLVAQDLAGFGADRGKNELLSLLRELETQTTAQWYRLLYVYPLSLSTQVLEFVGGARRFARYLDVPFQHASTGLLRKMKRGGTQKAYLDHVREIRRLMPGVALRTTLLVGHPGETEHHFQTLLEFIEEVRFEWMGVFPYSREEGTASARMRPLVPEAVSERRAQEAMDTFRASRQLTSFGLGEIRDALVIDKHDNNLICRTETEAPEVDGVVYVPQKTGIVLGQLIRVKIDRAEDLDFVGESVDV